MRLTALHIGRLAREFEKELTGGLIRGLSKSEKDRRIEIHISTVSGPTSLIFLFGRKDSAIFFVERFLQKITTTNFLPQLLEGRIEKIEQVGFDRVLRFVIRKDEVSYHLIFELFGQNSNLYFTDHDDRIITALKKSSQSEEYFRPPESLDLVNPSEFDIDKLIEKIQKDTTIGLGESLKKTFMGLMKDDIEDFITRTGLDLDASFDEVSFIELRNLLNTIHSSCRDFVITESPVCYSIDNRKIYIVADDRQIKADTLSEAIYDICKSGTGSRSERSVKKDLLTRLKQISKKEERKLQKIETQIEKYMHHEDIQKKAELLSINMHKVKSTADNIIVTDVLFGSHEDITIELDPHLSPGENLQKLFERARKYRDKLPGVKKELNKTQTKIEELSLLKTQIESLAENEDFGKLRKKLIELGGEKQSHQRSGKKEPVERLPYKTYQSKAGEDILVGRSARDNDRLTFKVARKHDLWLHSQQTAGSHVILRRPNRTHQFSKQSILEAAQIAVFFSNARNAEHVPVIYTEVRYVRKARKGAPGLVIPERTKTVFVDPKQP